MKPHDRSAQARRDLDRRFGKADIVPLRDRPRSGWIKTIRTALGMSQAVLAKRLQVSSAAVAKLERAETTGGITLGKLDDVARALDCSIFYAFVPHSTLESTVERQARRIALSRLGYVATTMALEEQDIPAEERADYLERYIRDLIARNDIWHESASEKVPSAG